jgi:hypothetical protein
MVVFGGTPNTGARDARAPPLSFRHGLNGSFIKRTLQLTDLFVNRFFKEFLKKVLLLKMTVVTRCLQMRYESFKHGREEKSF